MSALLNKNILLGISGGIAAYKSAYLARRLVEAGAVVRVIMTAGAQTFIQPMTLQALTGNPVHTELLDAEAEAAMGHIELARWADAVLIAPASANTLARLSHGMADDLLSTVCLATEAPLVIAPAMNRQMWANAATEANCRILSDRGVRFIGPAEGIQACGETGAGRMVEPELICEQLAQLIATDPGAHEAAGGISSALSGKHILITAGPTREAIDPVRFISNHSSGKMGYALAEAAVTMGARVTLVSGPVSLTCSQVIERINVESAAEMLDAVMQRAASSDVFISVAAVADYRLAQVMEQKIKKNEDTMQLTLVRNPDILRTVAAMTHQRPFCVGFAAETENVQAHARAKMHSKQLDMIAANDVAQPDNPVFGSDTNALDVFWRQGDGHQAIAADSKAHVARALLECVATRLADQEST